MLRRRRLPGADAARQPRSPTTRSIVARVFNNKAASKGYTPRAVKDHGTHVAGTVACNATRRPRVDGVAIPYDLSGVAPGGAARQLQRVPRQTSTTPAARTSSTRSRRRYAGRHGRRQHEPGRRRPRHPGPARRSPSTTSTAPAWSSRSRPATSGPGALHGRVARLGRARADRRRQHGAATSSARRSPSAAPDASATAAGDFATVDDRPDGAARRRRAGSDRRPRPAAPAALPGGSLTGKIALVSRGDLHLLGQDPQRAGRRGRRRDRGQQRRGRPDRDGADDGTSNQPTIPAVMVGAARQGGADRPRRRPGRPRSRPTSDYVQTAEQRHHGRLLQPGPDRRRLPGQARRGRAGRQRALLDPGQFCDAGTTPTAAGRSSRARRWRRPHLAGSAAVVRQAHPALVAAQVRSAIVNTADQGVLKSTSTGRRMVNDVNIVAPAGRNSSRR